MYGSSLTTTFYLSFQLHLFLRNVHFNSTTMDAVYLDEDKELVADYDIVNLITFPNESAVRVKAGKLETRIPPGLQLTVHEEVIVWPNVFNQVGNIFFFHKPI